MQKEMWKENAVTSMACFLEPLEHNKENNL